MIIHLQISDRLDIQIDQGVLGKQVKHMIQETDPGAANSLAVSIQIDRQFDIGFSGFALYRCRSRHHFARPVHGRSPLFRG
jgi:hypothetical protein